MVFGCPVTKGVRSAIKFGKSKIGKFEDLNYLLGLQTFRKRCALRICALRTQPFCDLRSPQIHIFPLINIAIIKYSNSSLCKLKKRFKKEDF
jgi:hypothetical protein